MNVKKGKSVLITGVSGYVGKHLLKVLHAHAGAHLIGIYKGVLPAICDSNVYPFCSDLTSTELLLTPLREVDCVVHCAWSGSYVNQPGPKHAKNIDAVKKLIAAMEQENTKRIVFLSALGAEKKTHHLFLKEKYEAEHLILNSSIPEKIILRSDIIYGGENSIFLAQINKMMVIPGFFLTPRFAELDCSPVHVMDVVACLKNEIFRESPGGLYIQDIRGSQSYSLKKLLHMTHHVQTLSSRRRLFLPAFLSHGLIKCVDYGSSQLALSDYVQVLRQRQVSPLDKQESGLMASFEEGIHREARGEGDVTGEVLHGTVL